MLVTQHLAVDHANGPLVTGAIYLDVDVNDFYSPGEGLGGFEIELQPVALGNPALASQTYASGGYRSNLSRVPTGSYRVELGARLRSIGRPCSRLRTRLSIWAWTFIIRSTISIPCPECFGSSEVGVHST